MNKDKCKHYTKDLIHTQRDKGIGYMGENDKDNANTTLFDKHSRSAVAK